jgi:predicted Zn-dependent peptidase
VSTAEAVRAIDEELSMAAEDGPTPDELFRAKRRELGAYHASADSRMGRLRDLGVLAAVHDQPELADELPDRYREITAKHVQEAIARWLRPEHSTVLNWLPAQGKAKK